MATRIKRLSSYDSEGQKTFIEAVISGDAKIAKPMTIKGIEKAFLLDEGDDKLLVLIDLNFAQFEDEIDAHDDSISSENEFDDQDD